MATHCVSGFGFGSSSHSFSLEEFKKFLIKTWTNKPNSKWVTSQTLIWSKKIKIESVKCINVKAKYILYLLSMILYSLIQIYSWFNNVILTAYCIHSLLSNIFKMLTALTEIAHISKLLITFFFNEVEIVNIEIAYHQWL